MTRALAVVELWEPPAASHQEWTNLNASAPQLVATFRRYLIQLTTFLAPRSVDMADAALRQFTRWIVATTTVKTVAAITRTHFEDYKVWLAVQPGMKGVSMAKNTQRHRLRTIKICFERL